MRKKRIYKKTNNEHKRIYIFEGTDKVGYCRITNNLDFFTSHYNCNPEKGKHKTISYIKDKRFVIIYSNDELNTSIGKIVTDEEALEEILFAKKFNLLKFGRYKRLLQLYNSNIDYYEKRAIEKRGNLRIHEKKDDNIIIVTNENNLVAVYSDNKNLKIKQLDDAKYMLEKYYMIWSVDVENVRSQKHRKLSEISDIIKKIK